MELNLFVTVFISIFLAEMADKTQIATLLFAATGKNKLVIFIAAALALTLATAVSIMLGSIFEKYINMQYLHRVAGVIFIMIGLWTIIHA